MYPKYENDDNPNCWHHSIHVELEGRIISHSVRKYVSAVKAVHSSEPTPYERINRLELWFLTRQKTDKHFQRNEEQSRKFCLSHLISSN